MSKPALSIESRVLSRLAASPLGWIEVHSIPGERRAYLAALGLAHKGQVRAEETRKGVLHVTPITK